MDGDPAAATAATAAAAAPATAAATPSVSAAAIAADLLTCGIDLTLFREGRHVVREILASHKPNDLPAFADATRQCAKNRLEQCKELAMDQLMKKKLLLNLGDVDAGAFMGDDSNQALCLSFALDILCLPDTIFSKPTLGKFVRYEKWPATMSINLLDSFEFPSVIWSANKSFSAFASDLGDDSASRLLTSAAYGSLTEAPLYQPPSVVTYLAHDANVSVASVAAMVAHLEDHLPLSLTPCERAETGIVDALLHNAMHMAVQAAVPAAGVWFGSIPNSAPIRPPLAGGAPDWCARWNEGTNFLAVGEVKGTYSSVHGAMAQAGVTAMAGAHALFAMGLPPAACVVPFFAGNGLEEKHGLAYVLDNGLPCVACLTSLCDLTTCEGRERAALRRIAAIDHALRVAKALDGLVDRRVVAEKTTAIEVKDAMENAVKRNNKDPKEFVFDGRFFLKSPTSIHAATPEQTLAQQLNVFEQLRVKCPAVVVLPLTCVSHNRTADGRPIISIPRLVFPNMWLAGYDAGVPADANLFNAWLDKTVVAVHAMHAAGIVHLDLHPHNTMHRRDPETVDIDVKIIDLDSALPRDKPVSANVLEHVRRGVWSEAYPDLLVAGQSAPPEVDWFFLTAVLLAHKRGLTAEWRQAPAPVREQVATERLRELMKRCRKQLQNCCTVLRDNPISEAVLALVKEGLLESELEEPIATATKKK